MATYRLLDQAPQYLLASGKVNAGGFVWTYETDLTTLKLTWSDPGKTTPNENPIPLDAAGRTETDVWCDGEYGVVVADAGGVPQWTRNNVRPGDGTAATALPTLGEGQFITSDGTTLIAVDILQVPDPTGEAGNILYSDGVLAYWDAPPATPEIPDPDIVITTTPNKSFRAGVSDSTTKFLIQFGAGTGPASGARTSVSNITFPTPFVQIFHVDVTQNVSAVGSFGIGATQSVSGYTLGSPATGATVTFNSADDGGGSGFPIINSIPFTWAAYGTVTVTP